jgi:hypothetical protein
MRIIVFFLLVANYSISQQFNIGYKDGWPIGYCYDAQYGCMAPPTPMAPYPRIGESSDNYWNGYHRGLADGIEKGRVDRRQKNQSNMNAYQSYGVPQYIPKYEPFTPDLNFYNQAMNQLQSNYDNKQNENENLKVNEHDLPFSAESVRRYSSIEEKEKRKKLMEFIFSQYESFTNYPKEIPDGFYKVHFVNDTKYSWKYGSGQLDDCEIRDVFVQNNKIIWVSYNDYYSPRVDFDCSILPNFSNNKITLLSGNINNGICYVAESVINKNEDVNFTQATEILSKNARYYFIEYLVKIRETKNILDQITIKYNSANKKQLISDGWHTCYLSNRVDFCEIRNVWVKDNKIVKWIAGNGVEYYVNTGGDIKDLKSTFSRKLLQSNDMNEQQKKFWKNTSLSREITEIYDAFFINL